MRVGALQTFHELQATSHGPLSKPPPRPSPKGREFCLAQVASRRRCVTVTAHHEPRTTNPRGGHTGPPLRRDDACHEPRAKATGHEPRAILLPSPRTTYYAPRTHRADTLVRPNDENAHTSRRPLAAASSYQPREPNGLRELESGPEQSPSLARVVRNMVTTQSPKRDFRNGPRPSFRWGDEGRCSWRRGSVNNAFEPYV